MYCRSISLLSLPEKTEEFVSEFFVGGQKVCQHLSVVVHVKIRNDDADELGLAVGKDSCYFIFL